MMHDSTANHVDVVVIGGGQAGLAMSRCLTDRGVTHVVLEKATTANTWKTERWDSLRLLTPNWLCRLPGFAYDGDDPDGYMTAAEVAAFLERYERSFDAPVVRGAAVDRVAVAPGGYVVSTSIGTWRARAVVLATGAASTPRVPAVADAFPDHVDHVVTTRYRNPDQLSDRGVLVVGASASGLQLADEIARSGRQVTVAVGDHVRLPRTYRGMDIHWWMDTIGQLDERYDEVEDIRRQRRLPSLQLVGTPERRDLDLNAVSSIGVRLVGRLVAADQRRAQFSGSLANFCASADLKERRLLDRIDEHVAEHGLDAEFDAPTRPDPTDPGPSPLELDLGDVGTVVWATGFRPQYPWLDASLHGVLDRKGTLVHEGGILPAPGMYVLGLTFMRRRKSSFLDGVGPDALELTEHLVGYLAATGVTV
jgi:putative flavoprotein involved in K+ transport